MAFKVVGRYRGFTLDPIKDIAFDILSPISQADVMTQMKTVDRSALCKSGRQAFEQVNCQTC